MWPPLGVSHPPGRPHRSCHPATLRRQAHGKRDGLSLETSVARSCFSRFYGKSVQRCTEQRMEVECKWKLVFRSCQVRVSRFCQSRFPRHSSSGALERHVKASWLRGSGMRGAWNLRVVGTPHEPQADSPKKTLAKFKVDLTMVCGATVYNLIEVKLRIIGSLWQKRYIGGIIP